MINKVILIGNLGGDPEFKSFDSGAMVAKFRIATHESYKDKSGEWQQITQWHNIVVWQKLAERAQTDLKKGTAIFLEGKITYRKYQDQNGNDRWITEIVANYFRRIGNNRESDTGYFPEAPESANLGGSEIDTPF